PRGDLLWGKNSGGGNVERIARDTGHVANHDAGFAARNFGKGFGRHSQRYFHRRSARGQSDAKFGKLFPASRRKGETRGAGNERCAIWRARCGVFARRRGRPACGGKSFGKIGAAAIAASGGSTEII